MPMCAIILQKSVYMINYIIKVMFALRALPHNSDICRYYWYECQPWQKSIRFFFCLSKTVGYNDIDVNCWFNMQVKLTYISLLSHTSWTAYMCWNSSIVRTPHTGATDHKGCYFLSWLSPSPQIHPRCLNLQTALSQEKLHYCV